MNFNQKNRKFRIDFTFHLACIECYSNCNFARLMAELKLVPHRGQNSKQVDIAKYVSKFLIYGAKMLDKCFKSKKKLYIVLFCKVKLSKMAFIKTNKIKTQTALF